MKKLILILACLCLLSTTAFAQDFQTAYDSAMAKHIAKDWTGAIAGFDTAYSLGTDASKKCYCLWHAGIGYYNLGNFTEAVKKFDALLVEAKGIVHFTSKAHYWKGATLRRDEKFAEALVELKKMPSDWKTADYYLSQLHIGTCMVEIGNPAGAQEHYRTFLIENANEKNANLVERLFEQVEQKVVGDEKYAEMLIILDRIRNTANSASLLGKVESQMEKNLLKKYFE